MNEEFNAAVEAGVRAMFRATGAGGAARLDFDEIPAELQEAWRKNFSAGFGAAVNLMSQLAPQSPQYRIRYLPKNSDGEKGVWYTGTPYGGEYMTAADAQEALAGFTGQGVAARIERRWVTEWHEVGHE